jgi:hypothetical protein
VADCTEKVQRGSGQAIRNLADRSRISVGQAVDCGPAYINRRFFRYLMGLKPP